MHRLGLGILGSIAVAVGCAGSAQDNSSSPGAGYGDAYQGDGVQCGSIICSGAQVCCIVPIPTDVQSMGPAGKCDQSCESVCADSCPDAGASSMHMGMPAGGMTKGDAAAGGMMMMGQGGQGADATAGGMMMMGQGGQGADATAGGMMMMGGQSADAMAGGMMMQPMQGQGDGGPMM